MQVIENAKQLEKLCDYCTAIEPKLHVVMEKYGYPPLWYREPNFATLVLTILEQQVSLASAKSAFNKLIEKIGEITLENILKLAEEELSACYFSRQKTTYVKLLSNEIVSGKLNITALNKLNEPEIRNRLIQIKGIGNWTVDMYVMMSLNHSNIFPSGDLATIKSVFELELIAPDTSKEKIILFMKRFSPYQTAATYLLWHYYIQKRNLKLE